MPNQETSIPVIPGKTTYILALEGGGTRSQAAVLTFDGQVLQSAEAGDVNTNFTALEQARHEVTRAVSRALNLAQIDGAQVELFVSALVGPRFGPEVFGELCPNARFLYFTERDVVFARGGVYHPHGIALVAATGATAWGVRSDDGRKAFIGGWGSLLGDEGSAYAMGLAALRAAARAYEGREPSAVGLVNAVCAHYGLQRETFRQELVRLAYQKPLSRADIAGLSPAITRLAAAGDEAAARICHETAADLAQLGLFAARQLFTAGESFDFIAAGGMVNAGDLILGPLRAGLADEFPNAALRIGLEPPAAALGKLAIFKIKEEKC